MTRLSAKTEIGVTPLTTRISASVSTIESPPASIGSAAATTPRKTQSASRKSSGNAISSARKRSCSDCDRTSSFATAVPPTSPGNVAARRFATAGCSPVPAWNDAVTST